MKIGPFPEVTIEQARKQAAKLVGQVAEGRNPAEEREARAAAMLGRLFEQYMEHHAGPNKRTAHEDRHKYEKHLKHWAGRKLDQVTRQDVARLHRRLAARPRSRRTACSPS